MIYALGDLKKGIFKARPNRYIAEVEIDGKIEIVHVHDPGRLKELLFEDNTCLVKYAASEKRKTDWDMIAAKKKGEFVLIHSGYQRYIADAILSSETWTPFEAVYPYKAEVKVGSSRLDFCLYTSETEKIWLEVKGCSLSENGIAKFPDAPTVRGRRHLEELKALKANGDRAAVLIIILSESSAFMPKRDTDPAFYETFYEVMDAGVEVYPIRVAINVSKMAIEYVGPIEILPRDTV